MTALTFTASRNDYSVHRTCEYWNTKDSRKNNIVKFDHVNHVTCDKVTHYADATIEHDLFVKSFWDVYECHNTVNDFSHDCRRFIFRKAYTAVVLSVWTNSQCNVVFTGEESLTYHISLSRQNNNVLTGNVSVCSSHLDFVEHTRERQNITEDEERRRYRRGQDNSVSGIKYKWEKH